MKWEYHIAGAIHIGLSPRHPMVQNDVLFTDGTYQANPTAGEPMDLFVFPAAVDDTNDFDAHRKVVWTFLADRDSDIQPQKVYLYLTGCKALITAFLWVWAHNEELKKIPLVLMHHDEDTGQYKEEYWG